MSRRVSNNKKVEKPMFCKVCKDAGESAQVCAGHNIRDVRGKVCCPNVMCRKCGMKGSHFDNECVRNTGSTRKEVLEREVKALDKALVKSMVVTITNAFAGLEMDSDSDEEAPPANVTIRTKTRKPANWADWESDDEDEGDVSYF